MLRKFQMLRGPSTIQSSFAGATPAPWNAGGGKSRGAAIARRGRYSEFRPPVGVTNKSRLPGSLSRSTRSGPLGNLIEGRADRSEILPYGIKQTVMSVDPRVERR